MANIIDLSVLDREPTRIKITETETIVIPGDVSTKFNIKLIACHKRYLKLQEDIGNMGTDEDAIELYEDLINLLRDVVLLIVQQDKNKKDVNMDYIDEFFPNEKKLTQVFMIGMNHLRGIETDPNFNTPK